VIQVFLHGEKRKGTSDREEGRYPIGIVSQMVNLSQKTIRDYEQLGLIKPRRDLRTNNRIYSDFEIEQIKHITHLIHNEGLTLTCIRRIIQLAPCWNIFACEVKEECVAFKNANRPCYEVRKKWETRCVGPCDQCVVYINRTFGKKQILKGPSATKR
jgi:DNA-binding transcriptional MerR regulator